MPAAFSAPRASGFCAGSASPDAACRLSGKVLINGRRASRDARVGAGDEISTGADGDAAFTVGGDAFLLPANSRLALAPERDDTERVGIARLLRGKLLAVFASRDSEAGQLLTRNVTIGIRGTGLYLSTIEKQDYLCLCYGAVDIAGVQRGAEPLALDADDGRFHIAQYLTPHDNAAGVRIDRDRPEFPRGHAGSQLRGLEALVGRAPPLPKGRYED